MWADLKMCVEHWVLQSCSEKVSLLRHNITAFKRIRKHWVQYGDSREGDPLSVEIYVWFYTKENIIHSVSDIRSWTCCCQIEICWPLSPAVEHWLGCRDTWIPPPATPLSAFASRPLLELKVTVLPSGGLDVELLSPFPAGFSCPTSPRPN